MGGAWRERRDQGVPPRRVRLPTFLQPRGGRHVQGRWCSVTAIPRGGAIGDDSKNALQAHQLATVTQSARKINVGRRERPEARFFRVDERDRRTLNTSDPMGWSG